MKFRYKKPTPAEVPVITAQASLQSKQRGSFSIDENVPLKMTSRFFKLCHLYFSSLKMSVVGEFPWSRYLGDRTFKFRN